jgi:subtilisin family serine protease
MIRAKSFVAFGILAAAACAEPPTTPLPGLRAYQGRASLTAGNSYVVMSSSNALPANLEASVAAVGGTVTARMDGIGLAVVTSDDPAFADRAARIRGVQHVVPDMLIDFGQPVAVGDLEAEPASHGPEGIGAHETFRLVQWAPDAIHAPDAWNAGYTGDGVRVAVLDGGIHSTHIDIAPNLDAAASRSFVPGATPGTFVPFNTDLRRNAQGVCNTTDTFWHGTHVAGILAAAANNIGTVGIAPDATIIGVKVLHCGSGAFSWIINGIYYAATPISEGGAGAQIINMSLGGAVVNNGPGAAHLLAALSRATSYANQRGVTVIAAAGNDGVDIDHTANLVFVPAQSVGVIAVSATAPVGFALGSANFDVPTSYTNFGQSAIDVAGPGGDGMLPGTALCSIPRVGQAGVVTQPCWVFDLVMAPVRGSGTSTSTYSWASGTSMASPAVAGVAALIVGKYGPISPAQVRVKLLQSADDLGKPGNDDFFGKGRVNAARALGLD